VPFAPADLLAQAGRPRWWLTGLVLSLLVGAGIAVVINRHGAAVHPQQRPAVGASRPGLVTEADRRADAATPLLARLADRLEHGTRKQVLTLAAPGQASAARELGTIRANMRALRVTDLSLRYEGEDAGRVLPAQQHALGGGAWVANVQISWRLRGFDTRDSHVESTLTLVRRGRDAAFVSARGNYGNAAPLWLLEPVSVLRSRRTLVMTTAHDRATRFAALANHAVADVRKVLRSWRGRLVVEVPADEVQLSRVLGSDLGAYTGIAAVTTTVDGSRSPNAPVHIFVNPAVFDPLGPRGSQIVMSHEATHVATGAAISAMPTWLLEGFADYVALAHVDLSASVTASQILAQVRRKGTPSHLPGNAEFNPRNKALGASYEAAWLACRLLAQTYGEQRLIRFYRLSDRLASTRLPFARVLHTDQQRFTRAWKTYLRDLAG
jgi:hypothetical protein